MPAPSPQALFPSFRGGGNSGRIESDRAGVFGPDAEFPSCGGLPPFRREDSSWLCFLRPTAQIRSATQPIYFPNLGPCCSTPIAYSFVPPQATGEGQKGPLAFRALNVQSCALGGRGARTPRSKFSGPRWGRGRLRPAHQQVAQSYYVTYITKCDICLY